MGYDVSVLVIFGIPINRSEYEKLVIDFHPKLFANIDTGKTPDSSKWDTNFESISDEVDEIVYGWHLDHDIPHTEYSLINVEHCDISQGFYIALHVHTHKVLRSADNNPKKINVPTTDDIKNFKKFIKPYLAKHNIKSKYQVTSVLQGSN